MTKQTSIQERWPTDEFVLGMFTIIDPAELGGAGSGFFKHKGRKGEVGGSVPDGVFEDPAKMHGTQVTKEYLKARDKADSLFLKRMLAARQSMKVKEWQAVDDYTEYGYHYVNGYLRTGKVIKSNPGDFDPRLSRTAAQDKQLIEGLDSLMAKSKLPENMVLYRAFGLNKSEGIDLLENKIAHPKSPLEFRDKGYWSTSQDESVMTGFMDGKTSRHPYRILMEIQAPAGAHGAPIAFEGTLPFEREWLLPRGSSMVVTEVTKSRAKLAIPNIAEYHVKGYLLP